MRMSSKDGESIFVVQFCCKDMSHAVLVKRSIELGVEYETEKTFAMLMSGNDENSIGHCPWCGSASFSHQSRLPSGGLGRTSIIWQQNHPSP